VTTTLVLLPAFPLWSAMYDAARPMLSHGCSLLTPDLRGFGDAPLGGAEPSVDVYADDVARLLDDRAVDRAVVGGTSMGGYVTMAMLRRHPDRVAGVVLVDTTAAADAEPARQNRERIARTVLEDGSVDVVLSDVFPRLLGDTTEQSRPEVVERVRGWVAAADPEAVAFGQRAMAGRPDSFETLRRAGVPGLVIVGEEDRIASVDAAQAMAEALPGGQLAVLPGSGHLSPVETPEAFAFAVSGWLSGL